MTDELISKILDTFIEKMLEDGICETELECILKLYEEFDTLKK